jgi:7-cyano-7-deazaguanine synthase
MNEVLGLNRKRPVTIHAPFVAKSKAETVALGLELGVNFTQTWSCYRGGESACGTCPTCVERLNAFKANGIADPISYL